MKQRKKLQDLTIKDNFMFGAVMVNEENCRRALELILEIPIAKVTVSKEKSIVYHPGYKGVRLDVVARDEAHTHYNIEMQVAKKPALGKRVRYYHSQIDMDLLQTGLDYSLLPNAYVIIICDYDPFDAGLYRYTWEMICREYAELDLEDGSHTIFLSTCGKNEEEVPAELVKFLKFVGAGLDESRGDFEDDFVRRLQNSVENIKASREMEDRYMLWEEMIKEERDEAKAEGRLEGRLEGIITCLLNTLTSRFEEIPEELVKRIQTETDSDTLELYFQQAINAHSLQEFEQVLKNK